MTTERAAMELAVNDWDLHRFDTRSASWRRSGETNAGSPSAAKIRPACPFEPVRSCTHTARWGAVVRSALVISGTQAARR